MASLERVLLISMVSFTSSSIASGITFSKTSNGSVTHSRVKGLLTSSICDATARSLPNQNVWILSCTVTPSVNVNTSLKFMCRLEMALKPNQGFHDNIKFYILRQNLHQTCFSDFSNVKWCMKTHFSLRSAK